MKYSFGAGAWACAALAGLAFLSVHCGGDDASSTTDTSKAGESSGGQANDGSNTTGGQTPKAGSTSTSAGDSSGGRPEGGATTELPVGGATTELPVGGAGAGGEASNQPIPISGTHHGYVIDKITMPLTAQESAKVAFDIDGDKVVDNQFGSVMALLALQGVNVNTLYAPAIERGEILMLGDVQATSLADANGVGFSTFFGKDPMPEACPTANDCGKHLLGTASFSVDKKLLGQQVPGSTTNNKLSGAGGSLPFRLLMGSHFIDVLIEKAHVELTSLVDGGWGPGRIGGAIKGTDVDAQIYPALQQTATDVVQRDCTGSGALCGCKAQTAGQQALAIFDTDKNCAISVDEVKGNAAVTSAVKLDVSIGANPAVKDAMSIAFSVTATKGTFSVP